jgi:hypothetical protein
MRGAFAVADEGLQDGAQARVISVAELAVLQQLDRVGRVLAGLHTGHANMRAPHVGGQERRRHRGGGIWTRRLSGVCNRSDNDVNDNLTLSMLRRSDLRHKKTFSVHSRQDFVKPLQSVAA